MTALLRAAFLATRDLFKPGMLWQALWPTLLSVFIWTLVAYFAWIPARTRLIEALPEWSWLAEQPAAWLTHLMVNAVLLLAFAPLVYFTMLMLLAAFALPRIIALVAEQDFADLERRGGGMLRALRGSIANTLKAGLIFVVGWLVTLPFLIIHGMLFVMLFFWLAWINQRTFRFDALADHASPEERKALINENRGLFALAGGLSALVTHIPVVNLLAPAWTALLFVHFCLTRLREKRQAEVGVEEMRDAPPSPPLPSPDLSPPLQGEG